MTINLRTAVAGETVHFRCGGSALISGNVHYYPTGPFGIAFNESSSHEKYSMGGRYLYDKNFGEDHPFDIVKVEPKKESEDILYSQSAEYHKNLGIFKQPDGSPFIREFDCERCRQESENPHRYFMMLCSHCGNKRCPHALDHRFKCTGSNDVGQVGEPL